MAAFDVFCAHADAPNVLPLEEYVLRLALMGLLSVDDVLWLERDQLRRTYSLLVANEGALREANRLLERKLAELEAAKEHTDPYYEARFRNECVKTQSLSEKLWAQDGELEKLRSENARLERSIVLHNERYDALHARCQKDAALWATGFRLSGKISTLSDKFEREDFEGKVLSELSDLHGRVQNLEDSSEEEDDLLVTIVGLKDLNERVGKLEALQWQEGEGQ